MKNVKFVVKVNRDACVHSARHTALTNLGLTGVDPFTLQRAAGHANITTTRKYVHPTPPAIKDAFQKKVRNERRDRRAARKRAARVAASPSIVEHQPTDTV
jgi:site-specific recombinase XerD